ncbi:uncharacterized protein LOC110857407 isoform X1 [Folsomia candida]|uniref:uncharacterized protein LOC110857407 isoform X1 n=1 Tax=Folsomia candida TaxID=158441 RepID=UPI0016053D72|nr:uncharacterized protein LOC110857407 isoform X1 [Folsomia candida]
MSVFSQLRISCNKLTLLWFVFSIAFFVVIINTALYEEISSKYFYYNDTGHTTYWGHVSLIEIYSSAGKVSYSEGDTFQEDGGFQRVGDDGLHVYSAFFGNNNTRKLIIIGIDKSKSERKLECGFHQSSASILADAHTNATKRNSADGYNTGLKYCPIFIECDIPEDIQHPNYVSINVFDAPLNDSDRRNILKIHYPPERPIYNISACLQPLYTNENVTMINPLRLIEWLEFQLMMGVQHFTFYNISAHPIISKVLKSYKEVSIIPWNIPFTARNEIRARGQYIQANDCSHRHRGVSRFVVTLDYDEFLIPNQNISDNFLPLFEHILDLDEIKNGQKLVTSLLFHADFSFTTWPMGANISSQYYNTNFLRIPTMTNFIQSGQAKFVQLPEHVVESGVHFVKQGVPGSRQYVAERNLGRYLHFRECTEFFQRINPTLPKNETCNHDAHFVENLDAVERFGEKILTRVDKKVMKLVKNDPHIELYFSVVD